MHGTGKLELRLCGELCGIIAEPMFLPNPRQNLHRTQVSQFIFISLVVHKYLAVSAIANFSRKVYPWDCVYVA